MGSHIPKMGIPLFDLADLRIHRNITRGKG